MKRSVASGSGYAIIAAPATASFTDTPLADGITRYYVVAAVNSRGASPSTAEASATTYSTVEKWRLTHFGTTSNTRNAADQADPDGDGWKNADEFASGTNPNNRASRLKVSAMVWSGNDMIVSFPTLIGKTYRVECSATL